MSKNIAVKGVAKLRRWLGASVCLIAAAQALASAGDGKTWGREEFRIRDPFILPEGDTYYLYESQPWLGGREVYVRTSKDLERWSDVKKAMEMPPEVKCIAVWAPEVHKYRGAYWLLTTLTFDPVDPAATNTPAYLRTIRPMMSEGFRDGKLQPRGVWVCRSERPEGPFKPVKMGSVTPPDWMCLDGTLWVEDGKPWMVFCHEWCQTGNGRMMAAPLSEDLSSFAAEPIELFRAACLEGARFVTDGPFLSKTADGGLSMIWSNFIEGSGYCILQCKSSTGTVAGPWSASKPIFTRDGGHGMVFRRFDGEYLLSLHQPNTRDERLHLFPLSLTDDGFALK